MGHISPRKQLGFRFPGPLSPQNALTRSSALSLSTVVCLGSPTTLAVLK